MPRRRSMLLNGLALTLALPRAVFWTYIANVGVALLFSVRLHAQLDDILSHSLASQRLSSAFDVGVLSGALLRLNRDAPSTGSASLIGPLLYLCIYFLLVPGVLFCYQTEAPGKLAILLTIGLQRFWRFFRIALLTLLVSALVLGPLLALQNAWSAYVTEEMTGRPASLLKLAGYVVILLVAALLRLYFDLVEVYTIALGEQFRADGRPDRRVRKTLLPALRTLGHNLPRAYGTFVLLALFGLLAVVFSTQTLFHMLAQPRVWPSFLVAQVGLLLLIVSRLWQRGAESILAIDYPLPPTLIPAPIPFREITPAPPLPGSSPEVLPASAPELNRFSSAAPLSARPEEPAHPPVDTAPEA